MAVERSEDYGIIQKVVDNLFEERETARRLDAILLAETFDLPAGVLHLFELLPPGTYSREHLCDQLNSSITGHGFGLVYGTVE